MPRMSFWGLNAIAWSALTAIGTLALAGATVLAIGVGSRQRKADRADFAVRLEAERHERADEDARQVSVRAEWLNSSGTACRIFVSSPVGYLVRDLAVAIAAADGAVTVVDDEPSLAERGGRKVREYIADIHGPIDLPMISFADRQGGLFYQYNGHTQRFAPGTSFEEALQVLRDYLARVSPAPAAAPERDWMDRLTRGHVRWKVPAS
jgi:hypothetical protein